MADNLCGPSNPTKGLVAHVDRDNSIQQDRLVTASPAGPSNPFRSNLSGIRQYQAKQAQASADAAFAQFTTASPPPAAGTIHPSFQIITNAAIPDLATLNSAYKAPISAAAAKTSWAQDFQRKRVESGQLPPADLVPARTLRAGDYHSWLVEPERVFDAPPHVFGIASDQRMMPSAPLHQQWEVKSYMRFASQGPRQLFQPPEPSATQYTQYPDNVAFADNTEEALNAAFAAYDADFEADMDQWMGTHADEDLNKHDDALIEIAFQEDRAQKARFPTFLPQNEPSTLNTYDRMHEDELRKAASSILSNLGEKPDDKYKNSSFFGLMERISTGEVVVQDNQLFDTASGQVIDNTNEGDNDNPKGAKVQSQIQTIRAPRTVYTPDAYQKLLDEFEATALGTEVVDDKEIDAKYTKAVAETKAETEGKGKGKAQANEGEGSGTV